MTMKLSVAQLSHTSEAALGERQVNDDTGKKSECLQASPAIFTDKLSKMSDQKD